MASEGEQSSGEGHRRRHSLRHATVILPQTGERIRRKVTLNNVFRSADTDGATDGADEQTPLLPRSVTIPQDSKQHNISTRVSQWIVTIPERVRGFCVSSSGRNVIKCSIAYLLATLAVFIPSIASLLGTGDSKHLVANVIVWYNPARSFGSMTQGTLFATLAFIFSATVTYMSMGVATLFNHLDLLPLGHAIILTVFCGGSLGLMSWVKQRLGDNLVNVSVALASIPIVTTITKEPGIHVGFVSHAATSQTLRMAVLGIAISTIVTLIIWPIFARMKLRENLAEATDSLANALASTTNSFLSGDESDLTDSEGMNTAISTLAKNLAEARNEYYVAGLERQYLLEKQLVKCIQCLAQDIGGLQSAASTQFSLLKTSVLSPESTVETINERDSNGVKCDTRDDLTVPPDSSAQRATPPRAINNTALSSLPKGNSMSSIITMIRGHTTRSDHNSQGNEVTSSNRDSLADGLSVFSAENAADIFEFFLDQLGPPMKSLAYTLQQILLELPFGPAPAYAVVNNSNFRNSLRDALELFAKSRKAALAAVYKTKQVSLEKSYWVAADFEEVAASCGHFSSSLQDLAENVLAYLDLLDELEEEMTERSRGRSWTWLMFWRRGPSREPVELLDTVNDTSDSPQTKREVPYLPTSLSEIPSRSVKRVPMTTASGQTTIRWRLWLWLSFMRRDDIRFAVKVGAGGALFATLAYIPRLQDLFFHWRLEWSLATYMVVCSMTIGAANTTTVKRLIGTSIGAILAVLVWVLSDDSPYVLAFLGWLVAFGCFYLMLVLNEGPLSRFILLTYNLSVLYSYSLSVADKDDSDEDEGGINPAIYEIVLHRLIAISIGCLYGLLVTRLIWPISARKKLKSGLSLLWLRMALIWKRRPLSLLTDTEAPPAYLDIREEFRLREFASLLETMRKNAESEFTLRRPFPTAAYARILKSTGRMLDALHALNVVIVKDLKASPGELALLRYTAAEREQLGLRLAHLLSVLASSIKLEYPLTDTLPEIEHTRDRLLARIFAFHQDRERSANVVDEDYQLIYVYTLVTGQLAKEVIVVSREMEDLYGTLDENILRLQ